MIAWVSPSLTVRSTPLRISLGPSSVSTETCRSLDLQGAMRAQLTPFRVVVDGDEHVVAVDLRRGRPGPARWPGRPVGLPVRRSKREPCSQHSIVQSVDLALGQRDGGVRADVVDGEDLVAVADHGDVDAVDVDARAAASVGDARRARRRARSSCGRSRTRRSSPARPRPSRAAAPRARGRRSCGSGRRRSRARPGGGPRPPGCRATAGRTAARRRSGRSPRRGRRRRSRRSRSPGSAPSRPGSRR